MSNVLITGVCGFIGSHLAKRLIARGDTIVGIDNLSDYYDVKLKEDRLGAIRQNKNFLFAKINIADRDAVARLFAENQFDAVVNLAAQVSVRYSIKHPHSYIDSNIVGFLNVLEGCRNSNVKHFVFASSSSVYGANTRMPYSVHHMVDHPISLYAATKKADELMAHAYASLYKLPCTGLRFFTVYGPWGRPDMSYFLFTKAVIEGAPIDIYNFGKMKRDFTYIADIVEGVIRTMDRIPIPDASWNSDNPDSASSFAPYKIYNIGNNTPIDLIAFIEVLENCIGKKAIKNFLPLQPGDVLSTYADIDDLVKDVGFKPSTPIEEGLKKFVEWYRSYYNV